MDLRFTLPVALGLSLLLILTSVRAQERSKFLSFPEGFKWCVSTSAHQIEGQNTESDWWRWEHESGHIRNGDVSGMATDHWNRVEEDVGLIRALNVQRYRFSLEWAKIEPKPGQWNWGAVQHYRDEIELLRKNGIEPLVTLQHFTLPQWVSDQGGWEWSEFPAHFSRYVDFVYRNLGSQVDDWITFNEPAVALSAGYVSGVFPPGKKMGFAGLRGPLLGMLRAHAEAYRRLHENARSENRQVRVGLAHSLRVFDPWRVWSAIDWIAAALVNQVFNWDIFDAVETGHLNLYVPFQAWIDETIPGLAHSQDFIGVNYYGRDKVEFSLLSPNFGTLHVEKDAPVTDMGWEIYPRGLYRVLKAVTEHARGKSIIITENGIADAADRQRISYVSEHLKWVHQAIQEGAPVEGYCYWSLLDNFEWAQGFFPRFGLYEVNYQSFKRTPRPSASWFSQVAEQNGLSE